MPVFGGGGRVAAALELSFRDPGAGLKAATSALTVACHSLSRQLATELRDHTAAGGDGSVSAPSA